MRMIKFRAWDRERNEMLPITSMDWNAWWVSCEPILEEQTKPLDYGERNSFQNVATDRHILMQYTGLKDKNGKESYEGDIIKTGNSIGVIVYKLDSFDIEWKVDRDFWNEHTRYHVPKGEIIGNIYETPAEVTP